MADQRAQTKVDYLVALKVAQLVVSMAQTKADYLVALKVVQLVAL